MNKTSKRILGIGLPLATVAMAGIAFAAWTATGTGSGSATGASAIDATVVASSTADVHLWPGNLTAVPVHFTVNNPNPYPVSYSTFNTAVIASVLGGPLDGSCVVGNFSLTATSGSLASAVPVPVGGTTPAGATDPILLMAPGADNDCQGAVVTVTLKVAGTQTS